MNIRKAPIGAFIYYYDKASIPVAVEVEINQVLESESLDETAIINKVIDNVNPLIY